MNDKRRREGPRAHVTHGVDGPPARAVRTHCVEDGAVGEVREGEGIAGAREVGPVRLSLAFQRDGAAGWDWGLGVDLVEE